MPPDCLDAIASEAERELVFLFGIASWAVRSAAASIESAEISPLIAKAAMAPIERGCVVGIGDPRKIQIEFGAKP